MTIEAKVIEDSISDDDVRLTTFQVRCHWFIWPEVLTHRKLSRNARSTRAVPTKVLLEEVRSDPAMPVEWGRNQPGMQAREMLSLEEQWAGESEWREAAREAARRSERLHTLGAHKQIANRILMPFMWMHAVISATDWENFFALRDHEDAAPEIRELARAMRRAMEMSTPRPVPLGDWHLPYVTPEERRNRRMDELRAISAARCARVSYRPFDADQPDVAKDLATFEKLVRARPIHASPMEHQAVPDHRVPDHDWSEGPPWWRNYRGWVQSRALIERDLGL